MAVERDLPTREAEDLLALTREIADAEVDIDRRIGLLGQGEADAPFRNARIGRDGQQSLRDGTEQKAVHHAGVLPEYGTGKSSSEWAASQRSRARLPHWGQWRFQHEL